MMGALTVSPARQNAVSAPGLNEDGEIRRDPMP